MTKGSFTRTEEVFSNPKTNAAKRLILARKSEKLEEEINREA